MFVDIIENNNSKVWKFFLLGEKEDLGKVQCRQCEKIIKTKELTDHLKEFHTKEWEPKIKKFEENSPKKFEEEKDVIQWPTSKGYKSPIDLTKKGNLLAV